jgi:predicted metal-dependent phosphoesterase TrpH
VSKVDLHIHSTTSDGQLNPADIVLKAAELGLTIIAITDHDTVDGIAPALIAAQAFPELHIIPGVEISTDVPNGEVHLLGYFLNHTDPELEATLSRFRGSRVDRAQKMLTKLEAFGLHVEWQRVQEIAGSGSIGRPHIAQAMLEKGYIASLKEAFVKYIGRGSPAYVEREKMTPIEAVELVLRANGLPVLAHPLTTDVREMTVVELRAAGLVGIEAYYNGYTVDEINGLLNLAIRYDLITTGGSDYHGVDTNTETMIGGADVPMECAIRLIDLAEQNGVKINYP